MASKPAHLTAVLSPAAKAAGSMLLQLAEAVDDLRHQISCLVIDAKDVALSIGRDGASFDVLIELPPLVAPERTIFLLEQNNVPGVHITAIRHKPAPGSAHRRIVTCKLVSPEVPSR